MNSHLVYILRDSSGVALYVGMTVSPGRRLAEHSKKEWGQEIASLEIADPLEGETPAETERRVMTVENPIYNRNEGGGGRGLYEERREGAMDKMYPLRLSQVDYTRWRADAARRGWSFARYVRYCLNEVGGRLAAERPPTTPPAREPEVLIQSDGVIRPGELDELDAGRHSEAASIPAGRAVPSPQGFTALREQARDLAERNGKCTADVARGTRCKLCGKIH